jgi:hypothetical protein
MKKGDRIKLSHEGLKLPKRPQTAPETWRGTVRGKGRSADLVTIVWDGRKDPSTYHKQFLEVITEGARA